MAFTVCDNKERQLACYKELSGGHFWPNTIKKWLLGESISSSTGIGAFVGRSAYTKAGGIISSDLFQDTVYFSDAELVTALAVTKLVKKAEALQQMNRWSWVEVCLDTDTLDYLQLQPELVGVPDKLMDTLNTLSSELEALEKQGSEQGWPEDIDQQYDAVEDKLYKLQQSIDDQYLKYSEDQMSYSGCVVSFDHAGKLKIHEGLARPSDIPQPEEIDSVEEQKTDDKTISGALSGDLGQYRQHMAQAALLRHPSLANDVLRYSVCVQILNGASWKGRSLLDITCSAVHSETSRNDSKSSRAHDELKAAKSALVTEWLAIEDEGERFKAFCALSEKQKTGLLTYCVAQSVTVGTRGCNKAQDSLVDTLKIPFRQYWRPTKDNYLGRLSAPLLIDLVGHNVRSKAWCEEAGNKKKSEIVADMETFFTQVDGNELASTWVPAEF
jgi:ParB family chromosome partitioning protein